MSTEQGLDSQMLTHWVEMVSRVLSGQVIRPVPPIKHGSKGDRRDVMLKRELVKEDVAELAHGVVWREMSDYYANAYCDHLASELAHSLMITIEAFVEGEHRRREKLEDEAQREREVQVYG